MSGLLSLLQWKKQGDPSQTPGNWGPSAVEPRLPTKSPLSLPPAPSLLKNREYLSSIL